MHKATSQRHSIGFANRLTRAVWGCAWLLLFRPSPRSFHGWRRFLLRVFGAKIGAGAHPYPSCRIWAPWNLEMHERSCLSDFVDCYCVDKIVLGKDSVISQYTFLCSASHDPDDPQFPLITAPVTIGEKAWVAADAFIGPGVTVAEGAVVGARSSVFSDVPPWTIVGGNPAKIIRERKRF